MAQHSKRPGSSTTGSDDVWSIELRGRDALQERLCEACDLVKDDDPEKRRFGYIRALEAAAELVRALFPSEMFDRPVVLVTKALYDGLNGIAHPLLAPVQRPRNRPPSTREQRAMRGLAAAAVNLFMVAGDQKPAACAAVARKLAMMSYKQPSGKPITTRTVAGWFQQVTEAPSSDFARQQYEHAINPCTWVGTGMKPREVAMVVLKDGIRLVMSGTERLEGPQD